MTFGEGFQTVSSSQRLSSNTLFSFPVKWGLLCTHTKENPTQDAPLPPTPT